MKIVQSFRWALAGLLLAAAAKASQTEKPQKEQTPLRVCADPNSLPFSNEKGEGFENAIAQIVAHRLGRQLEYVWRAQRRGFLREGLNSGRCDLVTAVPVGAERVRATRPYYRSSYVFVTRPAMIGIVPPIGIATGAKTSELHKTWNDFLYWDAELER